MQPPFTPTSRWTGSPSPTISGTCGKGISLVNARNAELRNITVTGYTGPLLSSYATTGKGLSGAATLEAPKLPEAIAPPAQSYVLK